MKFVCTVCGYVYDEEKEKVKFVDLPDSWTCPECGAPKALFKPLEEKEPLPSGEGKPSEGPAFEEEDEESMIRLDAGQLSALFSNLARASEKQYQNEAVKCFTQVAAYFETVVPKVEGADLKHLDDLIKDDLNTKFREFRKQSEAAPDRGALRAVVWGEKVAKIARSLVDRCLREGTAFLENTSVWVCGVCGFIYVGEKPPLLCPVCKAPQWKFEKIEGRAAI